MDKNSQEIIVKFDEVTKQYGDLVVLDKLNLNIKIEHVNQNSLFGKIEKNNMRAA